MPKTNKTTKPTRAIRNNFYFGSVVQKVVNKNNKMKKIEVVCLYNTVAYRDSNDLYFDFLSEKQLEVFSQEKVAGNCEEQTYFLKGYKYFSDPNFKNITKGERVALFDVLGVLSKLATDNGKKMIRKLEFKD